MSHAIIGPDGQATHSIQCHPDVDDCWEEAGNDCGRRGYRVLNHSTHMGGTVADLIPGPVLWHTVLVECR